MKLFRRFINPVFAFIGIQLLWLLVVIFWIYWFMGKHRQLRTLAERYSPELAQRGADWFILIEGSLAGKQNALFLLCEDNRDPARGT